MQADAQGALINRTIKSNYIFVRKEFLELLDLNRFEKSENRVRRYLGSAEENMT